MTARAAAPRRARAAVDAAALARRYDRRAALSSGGAAGAGADRRAIPAGGRPGSPRRSRG